MADLISVQDLKKALHIDGNPRNASQTIDLKTLGKVIDGMLVENQVFLDWTNFGYEYYGRWGDCPKCGTANIEGSSLCRNCGKKVVNPDGTD